VRFPARLRRPGTAGGGAIVAALLVAVVSALPVPAVHSLGSGSRLSPQTSVDSVTIAVGSVLRFSPSAFSVTAGDAVSVEITQTDSLAHTFVLSGVRNFVLNGSWSPVDLYHFFNTNPPLANVSIPARPGASVWANFTAPNATGNYEYVCIIPGHFQAGMRGNMTVTTSSGGGVLGLLAGVITILIIVIIILIVIAIVAAVMMRRRRRRTAAVPPPATSAETPPSSPPPAGP
jgi:plastocyanin